MDLSPGPAPRGRAENRDERSIARWLSERRREAAEGALDPALETVINDPAEDAKAALMSLSIDLPRP